MLKDIVSKQKLKKEELLKSQYVDRTKGPFAKKWLDSNLIKVVLGPRRAGKSVFSLLLLRDHDFSTLILTTRYWLRKVAYQQPN